MNNSFFKKLNQLLISNKFAWIIIFIGVALRLIRYLQNTPLWFDESVIAIDIINRPLAAFLTPSHDYTQTGPISFYMLSKISVLIFGNSEYALRLFPLLFGILSLLLFYRVAKGFVSSRALPVALSLFVILDSLIYYSTELKPYSGDVFFALLVLFFIPHKTKELDVKGIAIFTSAGVIAILSSNPSVFVLAGVGTGLILYCLLNKDWLRLKKLFVIYTIWGLCFVTVFFVYTRNLTDSMTIGMQKAFEMEKFLLPFPPKSLLDIKWFIDFFFDTFLFQDTVMYVKRVSLSGIIAFSFLVGFVVMFNEKRDKFYVLIFPVLITFLAALMHQYPFKGRQILFLVPMFLLIISEGAEYIRDKISDKSAIIGVIFLCLLFIYPVSWAAYHVKKPLIRSEIRSVLNHINNNWQEGDIIYVHFFAQYAMEYYLKYHPEPFDFNDSDYIIGIGPRGWYNVWRRNNIPERYRTAKASTQSTDDLLKEYISDLNQLRGRKRVWVLFTGDVTMERFFLGQLDLIGGRKASFGHSGLAITYLYDLSK